jgi:hypothetical protein
MCECCARRTLQRREIMASRINDKLRIEIEGAAEVAANLNAFNAGRARKMMRSGMTKALRRLLKKVKAAAPHDSYALYKSLISETRTEKKDKIIVGVVGVAKRGSYTYTTHDGKQKHPNIYGYAVERGTVERYTKKGKRLGRVRAAVFMQNTLDGFRGEFDAIYQQAVSEAIAREFAKTK